jgi:anti-sigma B factor antagonist
MGCAFVLQPPPLTSRLCGAPPMGSLRVARNDAKDANICPSDQHALVRLFGELDLESAPQLSAELEELARTKVRHVAFDLSALEFLDSIGLALFLAEHQRVESLGGELIILLPCRQVRALFEATGVNEFFNVRPPIAAALT